MRALVVLVVFLVGCALPPTKDELRRQAVRQRMEEWKKKNAQEQLEAAERERRVREETEAARAKAAQEQAAIDSVKTQPLLWVSTADAIMLGWRLPDGWVLVGPPTRVVHDLTAAAPLSDEAAEPVNHVRPLAQGYRGSEGWQAFRWAMTVEEARKLVPRNARAKPEGRISDDDLEWTQAVADEDALVRVTFASGRLAGVSICFDKSLDEVGQMLRRKYGDPKEITAEAWRWQSKETRIATKRIGPRVCAMYLSVALALDAATQFHAREQAQADEL